MNPITVMPFLYGVVITMVLMKLCYFASDKGTTYGECPYCRKMATVHYETMYECSECKERHTDSELKEKASYNEWQEEQEKEREFQRIHDEQRKQDYREKLSDLNSEYSDVRNMK